MRITGGEAKGRQIKVPNDIRPTQDKLRATIFDVLGDKIKGTKFIDLFAGSGSVGIEALSRGAKEAVFVEQSKKVIPVLKANLELLGYSDRSKIINKDALKLLNSQTFKLSDSPTIIFADPPYNKGYVGKIVGVPHIIMCGTVAQNNKAGTRPATTFIIEHSKHEPIIPTIVGRKHYKLGDSIITFISEER